MTDEKEKLVLQTGHSLITRSSRLVRRGLNDLVENKEIRHWQHSTQKELFGEIKRMALQLVLDDDNNTDAINTLGMKFVLISSGKFMMGSDKKDDEQPIHEVSLEEPFFMACHPVMESEWREVMKASPERLTADGKAVGGISWEDAEEFINKLNLLNEDLYLSAKKHGDSREGVSVKYRLPTEAEWEYACRAGLTGDVTADVYFMDIYGEFPRGRTKQTAEIKQPRPNAFGLYDMLVGHFEWCEDRYHMNYNGAPCDGSSWGHVPGSENRVAQMNRVARGALSGSDSICKRASARTPTAAWCRGPDFGFRVVANAQGEFS